ncbi:SIT4 phosphatase-associated protein-domain-containing protein [Phycomyces nitens]|nr:SIT4 phosphatase-associated protein-domain-containing protein [Phycomyces nitens]
MFWRFGFHNPSVIDTLLDRGDVKLDEVLEEEDLLQEAKSHNQKLVDFLVKPENLCLLIHYITAPDLDANKRLKYPFLASEIMACEIPQILDAVVLEHRPLLESLWAYLDRPAAPRRRFGSSTEDDTGLDSLQASYFCKVISILMSKQTAEMLKFITAKPDNLKKLLAHIQTSAIMDLLLTLIRMEELEEGKGIIQWISDHGLLEDLIDRLDPYLDDDEHSVAQQCICEIIRMSQTSVLESPSVGSNDLIVKLKSQPVMKKLTRFMLDTKAPNSTSTLINGVTIIIDLIRHNNNDIENDPALNGNYGQVSQIMRDAPVSLADMLEVLADHVGNFNKLLLNPKSIKEAIAVPGRQESLGFERLRICELFAELLHCSNMSNLNSTTPDEPWTPESPNPKDSKPDETKKDKVLPMGDYLKQKFVQHKVMPTCVNLFFAFPWNNVLHYVVYDMLHQVFNGRVDKGLNRNLIISVLKDGQLTDWIIKAQKLNDIESEKRKGTRLGYMGHLTFISDEIVKVFEGYPESILNTVKSDIDLDSWNKYCNTQLRETKERDRLPLGGARPNDDPDHISDDDEEEDGRGVPSQFSRYLVQHGGQEKTTEEYDEVGSDRWNRDTNDDKEEEEEEPESNKIITDWTRGFQQFPHTNTLHRTQSHHPEDSYEDDVDDDEYDHLADTTERQRRANIRRGISVLATAEVKKQQQQQQKKDEEFGDFMSASSENELHKTVSGLKDIDLTEVSQPTWNDQNYVRAVKTKEEERGKVKDFCLEDEEQEGEI